MAKNTPNTHTIILRVVILEKIITKKVIDERKLRGMYAPPPLGPEGLTFMSKIPCRVVHEHTSYDFFGSNKSYWVYLSMVTPHYVISLPIYAGQGGAVVFRHPVQPKDWPCFEWRLPLNNILPKNMLVMVKWWLNTPQYAVEACSHTKNAYVQTDVDIQGVKKILSPHPQHKWPMLSHSVL